MKAFSAPAESEDAQAQENVDEELSSSRYSVFTKETACLSELVSDCSAKTLQALLREKIAPENRIHSDGWKGYDGLVYLGFDKHFRINKSKYCAGNSVHINGIEAFWSFTKPRLANFHGVKKNVELHLKECEWRYNKSLPQLVAILHALVTKNKS